MTRHDVDRQSVVFLPSSFHRVRNTLKSLGLYRGEGVSSGNAKEENNMENNAHPKEGLFKKLRRSFDGNKEKKQRTVSEEDIRAYLDSKPRSPLGCSIDTEMRPSMGMGPATYGNFS
ncbi:hypothetical protein PROFUN_00185 [Planoprotostelium fungivorum]|uniref:Uncharacterized protein n=1 Tax=Planoprotostelium fungivorum TaxID=1890364 RepID=A0A2P6P0V7_9EUKA|nr:hypothetical protein PROFUN_00185 [Planoprotostelium fungivorum]